MSTVTADARFLRRILIGLILATVLAGAATWLVTVEAASPGFVTQTRTATVRSGVTQRQDFVLEPERAPEERPFGISGTVSGRQAGAVVPLEAATVKIADVNTGAALDVSISAGTYKAEGPKGTYRIDVASPRFAPQSRTITAASVASLTENFVLEPQGDERAVITGTVAGRNAAGTQTALRAATVKLTNRDNTTVDAEFRDGTYTIAVPPGPYRIEVASQRFVTETRNVTARSGERVTENFVLTVAQRSRR